MQNKVKKIVEKYNLSCGSTVRYIDLVSEIGKLGKEILKETPKTLETRVFSAFLSTSLRGFEPPAYRLGVEPFASRHLPLSVILILVNPYFSRITNVISY